jgi:diguanylate cyclase
VQTAHLPKDVKPVPFWVEAFEDVDEDRPMRADLQERVQVRKNYSRTMTRTHGLFGRILQALPEGHAIAEDVWRRRHRAMVFIVWLHAVAIPIYAVLEGKTIGHGLFEAAAVVAAGAGAKWGPNNRRFRSVAATLGLVISSAVLVHLSGGLVELHFHYFVTLALVSLYHDWAPFLTAIGFVAVQHGISGVLDPSSVYNHAAGQNNPWKWAGIHAGFVLAASAVSLVRWKSSEVEALKDPLTSLPNRALFGDRLHQAIIRGRGAQHTTAVLFLDVDDFKTVNDTAGHPAGDRLLIVVAERLSKVVRPSDTVARLGGDEFALLMDIKDPDLAAQTAQRILDALRAPLLFEGRQISVTASIGVALRTSDDIGEDELVRNADIAMYVAKKNGKGRYAIFEPTMHEEVVGRTRLVNDLNGVTDRGELRLLYQPVVSLTTGEVVGFESLVRWQHPQLGMLAPLRFITLAEESGEIIPLGRWVLQQACNQAQTWAADFTAATPRWMSVNVSVRQLAHVGFVEDVRHALISSGLPAERLVLEITESAMAGDNLKLTRTLHAVKALGVRIALDDFGTGYSSLGYLRTLPIDILKIDKSFVDGTDKGPEDAALARAILKIAESMGLICIAEGVERDSQASQLRHAGCEFAQGFLFDRPMDAVKAGALLAWTPVPLGTRGTILVVDDDPDLRVLTTRRLREAGFSTVDVATGAQAMEVLAREHIDLVLLDLVLPDVDGLELAQSIRHDNALRLIPILMLSGHTTVSEPRLADLGETADGFIAKHLSGPELVDNISDLLASRAS